jgi:uncharacterized protein YbaP (TraB family)
MKKAILLLLTYTLLFNIAQAQTTGNNSLLWEISGNGLKASSYVFGTYHLAGKTLVDSLPEIGKRFNACKTVVVETIIDLTSSTKLTSYMMAQEGATLDKVFSPEEYKAIADCVKEIIHVDLSVFNGLKPSALASTISALSAPNTLGAGNFPMDIHFQQEGRRLNAKVIGLETLEQQARLLLNEPMEVQKKQLLAIVKKKDELRKNALEMYTLYRQQNLDGLKKMVESDDDLLPEQNDKLLKNRNLTWVTLLPTIMQDQPTFIAVGAAHLIGNFGLINQLRLKGYTVKAVKI